MVQSDNPIIILPKKEAVIMTKSAWSGLSFSMHLSVSLRFFVEIFCLHNNEMIVSDLLFHTRLFVFIFVSYIEHAHNAIKHLLYRLGFDLTPFHRRYFVWLLLNITKQEDKMNGYIIMATTKTKSYVAIYNI